MGSEMRTLFLALLVIFSSASCSDLTSHWRSRTAQDGEVAEGNSSLLAPQPPFPSSPMKGLALSFISEKSEDVKPHLHSVMDNLPKEWHLLVITTETLREYVDGVVEEVRKQMHQDAFETGGWIGGAFNRPVYISSTLSENSRDKHCLLLKKAFYEALPTEHLLTIDTNSIVASRQGLPDKPGKPPVRQVTEFLDYAFIGKYYYPVG